MDCLTWAQPKDPTDSHAMQVATSSPGDPRRMAKPSSDPCEDIENVHHSFPPGCWCPEDYPPANTAPTDIG